jgi:hypothetical protein
MPSNEFETLLLVNDELASLSRLGVPFDLGLGRGAEQISQELQRINADAARKMSQGVPLDTYLESLEHSGDVRYASTMRYALATGRWSTVLDQPHEVAAASQQTWWSIWSGMTYPLLICFLAYCGLVAYCLYLVPLFESMYTDLRVPVGTWLGVMSWLQANLWWWGWGVPLLLLAVVSWLRWQAPNRIARSGSLAWNHRAQLADTLGDLAASDVPTPQSVELAKAACLDRAAPRGHHAKPSRILDRPKDGESLPPLLRWMTDNPGDAETQSEMLHSAASSYRGRASLSAERLDRRAVLVPCVIIGGGVALLYGLALFLPSIELLTTLATEPARAPLPY